MADVELLTAENVDPAKLAGFLQNEYPPSKSCFLIHHGAWWHRSDANRLVILVDELVAGYCAVIPVRVWAAGQERSALWWVDLIISLQFRGRGLQTLFDRRVREMGDLLLGFPNEVAAKIHRKHGWGVREDLKLLLLPLWPSQVKSVRAADGARGVILRNAALALTPLASLWRWRIAMMRPSAPARIVERPSASLLASVYQNQQPLALNATFRDEAHFEWRYFASPHIDEYTFYTAGDPRSPSHYLVARHLGQGDLRYTRILDVFGDFTDLPALHSLFLLALKDASVHHSCQVTILTSIPELPPILRRLGFFISVPVSFCWQSQLPELMAAFAGKNYWILADSDNDAPD